MLKNNASRQSTWDQELQYVTGCKGATPTQVSGVGDRAVVDMSCHAVNGRSLLMTEAGGEIITISASADTASKTDPAAAQPALIDVAQRLIEAR